MVPRYDAITVPTEILHGTADTDRGSADPFRTARRQIAGAGSPLADGWATCRTTPSPTPVIEAVDRAAASAGLRP